MGAHPIVFEPLGRPPPAALTEARVALHWAVQVVAAAGAALIPAVPDDSHTSLEWSPAGRLLVGGMTPRKARLGLRPSDFTLVVVDATGNPQRELPLAGRTLEAAFAWTADALGSSALHEPSYEMPDHIVAHGGAFGATDPDALAELARWYASADALLRDFLASRPYAREDVEPGTLEGFPGPPATDSSRQAETPPRASPVRCWPHHFDIATLVSLPGGAPSGAGSIGVGLSPGDGSYAEPYFYVTPWPYPQSPTLPGLPAGAAWHQSGWVGAVLTATAIFRDAGGSPAARAERVREFLDVAARASAALLGG